MYDYRERFANRFQRFINGIRNLIFWLPIIWKDRDWDEDYLIHIVIKKLRSMQDFHENHSSKKDSALTSMEIKIKADLLEKGLNYNYMNSLTSEDLEKIQLEIDEENKHGHAMWTDDRFSKIVKAGKIANQRRVDDIRSVFSDDFAEKLLEDWWD